MRDQADDSTGRLEAVLDAYALIAHHRGQHDADLGALLHHIHYGGHGDRARQQLHSMIRDLVAEAAACGDLRDDVTPDELATYCVHALGAAASLPSETAVHRLVAITLTGLRQPTVQPLRRAGDRRRI